jgi:hypothetical protein
VGMVVFNKTMEQNIQKTEGQNLRNNELTGNMTTALILMIIGAFTLILFAMYCFFMPGGGAALEYLKDKDWFFMGLAAFSIGILFIISSILIVIKRKIGWWLAMVAYFLFFSYSIFPNQLLIYFIIPSLPCLLFLIFDRKNFWQAER